MVSRTPEALVRPYAPPANVVAILQRVRRMNMPPRISREFLRGAGLGEAIIPRVAATLRFLGLINETDEPTDILRSLASSSEEEYKQLLEQTLRTAYAEDFVNIDPATDPQSKIVDTFQRYFPKSQHSRQVMLFLGLCRESGMQVMDAPKERSMQQSGGRRRVKGVNIIHGTAPKTKPRVPPPDSVPAGTLFGVTGDDIAVLNDEEFQEVWSALGKVARARSLAKVTDGAEERTDEEETEA